MLSAAQENSPMSVVQALDRVLVSCIFVVVIVAMGDKAFLQILSMWQ